ncbi:SusC/RagA family TonB-linked outer membrane protein [Porphyromonas pogonae]|uniref:SusC/RagA family TonB-linked outer membrane protein n=1 Tax=Porphyromonas pogonae TaxID=867595 RepID=UPI002E7A7877|nr:SusC/RagA family TonB-linked outer membrane protein [Porphyromonas pogonae]
MRIKEFALLIIIALCFTIEPAYAQVIKSDVLIEGKVCDKKGEPLIGAAVRALNKRSAAVTDVSGRFSIRVSAEKGDKIVLRVSYIGMKTTDVIYNGQKTLTVKLDETSNLMKEVVVTARPNINALDIRAKSGVVAEVNMKELVQKPMIDISLALQGNVPGLVVINRGELGTKPEIRIRGNSSFRKGDTPNEPLYVLDGQVISPEAFLTLNPLDIKEIKVLKDAVACALYGVKAANGVLEITSKRGMSGPLTISISTNVGITSRGRQTTAMMDTREKLEIERKMKNPNAPGYFLSADFINFAPFKDVQELYKKQFKVGDNWSKNEYIAFGLKQLDSLGKINNNWFNELMRTNYYQSHNLSMRGGTDELTYYVSGNFSKQGGQLPGNDTHRFTGRMSLDWKNKMGYLSLSTNMGYAKKNTPNGSNYSLLQLVYQLNPYESKDSPYLYSYPGRRYQDLMNQFSKSDEEKRFGTTFSFNLEPIKGLLLAGVLGVDYLLDETLSITPATAYSEIKSGIPPIQRGAISGGKNTSFNYTSNLRATYSKIFNEVHDLTISANTDYYYTLTDLLSVSGHGIGIQDYLGAVNKAINKRGLRPDFSAYKEKTAQFGLGFAAGYTYNSTYDLFASYKTDASSVLPKDKRWNYAWALGVGINMEKYGFLKDNKILTKLNIKASMGKTASLAGVPASSAIPVFSYNQDGFYGDYFRLLRLEAMYNLDLRPEKVSNTDLGLGLQLFSKYNLDIQFYRRDTKDALLSVAIPSSNGFKLMTRNVGELRNEGIEASFSSQLLNSDIWSLSFRTSLAYNRNKVLLLYDKKRIYTSEDGLIPDYEEGKPYDILYGLISLGVNPLTGYPVIKDSEGNEKGVADGLTRKDFVNLGHSSPPYQGTFGFSVGYKNFDLDAQFYYVFGGKKPYSFTYVRTRDEINKNAIKGQLDRTWFEPGDNNKLYPSPSINTETSNNLTAYPNTRMIAKSDYLRLSMLSLRYRLPKSMLLTLGNFIDYAAVSFQGSNLFTLTPYDGSSPESGSYDIGVQPVFTINLNVNF